MRCFEGLTRTNAGDSFSRPRFRVRSLGSRVATRPLVHGHDAAQRDVRGTTVNYGHLHHGDHAPNLQAAIVAKVLRDVER